MCTSLRIIKIFLLYLFYKDLGPNNLRKLTRMVSSDIAPGLDPSLHTVTEEDEGSMSSRNHSNNTSFAHSMQELAVTSESGTTEDEIFSTLITLTFEFLSKDTKPKIDASLINTDSQQIENIVNYFGQAMGFEPSLPWKVNKSMNIKRFRFLNISSYIFNIFYYKCMILTEF